MTYSNYAGFDRWTEPERLIPRKIERWLVEPGDVTNPSRGRTVAAVENVGLRNRNIRLRFVGGGHDVAPREWEVKVWRTAEQWAAYDEEMEA